MLKIAKVAYDPGWLLAPFMRQTVIEIQAIHALIEVSNMSVCAVLDLHQRWHVKYEASPGVFKRPVVTMSDEDLDEDDGLFKKSVS